MPRYIPIDKTKNLTHGWSIPTELKSAKTDTIVPVQLDEIGKLLAHYLLVFVKKREGGYMLVALQSLCRDENVYLTPEGKTIFPVLPRHYQVYPFALKIVEKEGERGGVILFDHESGFYREKPDMSADENRFFTDEGEPSAAFASMLELLKKRQEMEQVTQAAVDALEEADLLVPFAIDTEGMEVDCTPLKGIYTIDQEKLQKLEGEQVEKLYQSHAFALAYAQLFSMPRLETLKYLYRVSRKKREKTDPGVVEAFFDSDNETIDIDWSKL